MHPKYPISPPATYVTAVAVGIADADGSMSLVGEGSPMPVITARASAPEPLQGTAIQSLVAGPFAPLLNAPMHVQLGGEWTGKVELQRSIDGGATRSGLTVAGMPWGRFTANANEVVWQEGEEGAAFYLDIELASGTLSYRLSQ